MTKTHKTALGDVLEVPRPGGRCVRTLVDEPGETETGLTASGPRRYVRDVMTANVTTLGRNDRLQIADDLMNAGRMRHLPVLDESGHLAGIVSQRDLFQSALLRALGYGSRARAQVLQSVVVKEVMTTEVVTTTPDTPLVEAARVMATRKIGALPVLDADGGLAGIITEGDFVAIVAAGGVDDGPGETDPAATA